MSPSVRFLISSALGAAVGLTAVAGAVLLLALPAGAQAAGQPGEVSGEFERPYGFGYGEETRPFDAATRDARGNRVIIDGVIQTGEDLSSLSPGLAGASQSLAGSGFHAAAQAIGNQVNVITHGSYNTVIVTANQTNSGDQSAVLNGRLSLQ